MSISIHLLHLFCASISPATLPASAPAPATPSIHSSLISAAGCIAFSILIARLLGVFTPRGRIRTPDRVSQRHGAKSLLLVMLLGGGAWLVIQMLYGQYLSLRFHQNHPGQAFNIEHLGPYDLAFLSTIPALLGLALLLMGDRAAGLVRRLGYNAFNLPWGIVCGIGAAISALPLVIGCGALLELFYRHVQFQHPAEHELLGAMKDATRDVRIILVIGACVVAPIFEEMLFRGHLQTLLGAVFTRRDPIPANPIDEAAKPQAVGASSDESSPLLDDATPSTESIKARRHAWVAIILTSLVFASIHPMWMAPLIFVLAMCLGYVYERTGNLWACIVLHAIFNSSQTWFFLHMS